MKKILFVLIPIFALVFSCKKEHKIENGPVDKLQRVNFKLGFSQSTSNIGTSSLKINSLTTDTSLTNHIDVLYYMVFDSVGNNLHNITQLSSDTAFGRYTDNLQRGKYTVAIAGGKSGLVISPGSLAAQFIYYQVLDPLFSQTPIPGPFDKDAFFYRSALTVGNTSVTQNVSLSRIVSELVVNINDAIPANATRGQLTLNYYTNTYMVGDGSKGLFTEGAPGFNQSTIYNYDIASTAWGKTNYQLTTLFLPPSGHMSVDAMISMPTVILGEKLISNVTGQPDKITLLSGNMFGGTNTGSVGGFKVLIDSTWNTPVTKTFP